jgi:hypothetical protein
MSTTAESVVTSDDSRIAVVTARIEIPEKSTVRVTASAR